MTLLMIEPKGPCEEPVDDLYTAVALQAWNEAKEGRERWKGTHTAACGARSDSSDWYVRGMKTNSLMVHYVTNHRSEVPEAELEKLRAFL